MKLTFIRFAAIQFHLYHEEASRAQQESNYLRAMESIKEKKVYIEKGVHQYLQKDIHKLEPAYYDWQINRSLELISA